MQQTVQLNKYHLQVCTLLSSPLIKSNSYRETMICNSEIKPRKSFSQVSRRDKIRAEPQEISMFGRKDCRLAHEQVSNLLWYINIMNEYCETPL